MRAVVQRISKGCVRVDGEKVAEAGRGLLVLVGFCKGDTEKIVDWLAEKLISLRVFEDPLTGKMNLSLKDVKGDLILVSQFTLCATLRKGTRPSFDEALPFSEARSLYEALVRKVSEKYSAGMVSSGVFGARMEVEFVNDGPVTVLIEKVL